MYLVISFQLGENSSGGSQQDYLFTKKYIDTFRIDLLTGFEMFKSRGEIHLPFFYILIANLNKVSSISQVKEVASIWGLIFLFLNLMRESL